MLIRLLIFGLMLTMSATLQADIPWPKIVKRLTEENARLAHRPQGHNGEYFLVCTLYYTPLESGFTRERGFDVIPITKPGLRGRKYPRDFLRSVKQEGFGRIVSPVNGRHYIRYLGNNFYGFVLSPSGAGRELVPRVSAAARLSQGKLRRGTEIETTSPAVKDVFGRTIWRIVDTGGALRRWQVDLYYGEDEPLGPGELMGRPRGTTFEYDYSNVRITPVK